MPEQHDGRRQAGLAQRVPEQRHRPGPDGRLPDGQGRRGRVRGGPQRADRDRAGPSGAICLAAATINGQLSLSGSTLANATGPALVADFAQINGGVLLDQGFVAVGTGPAGAVCLIDASVGRELRCAGRFVSPSDTGGPPMVALNLTRTRAGALQLGDQHHGFLVDGLLELDGLSYTGLPGLGDLERLGPRPPAAAGAPGGPGGPSARTAITSRSGCGGSANARPSTGPSPMRRWPPHTVARATTTWPAGFSSPSGTTCVIADRSAPCASSGSTARSG